MAISKFTTAKVNSEKGKVEITDVDEEIQEVNITVGRLSSHSDLPELLRRAVSRVAPVGKWSTGKERKAIGVIHQILTAESMSLTLAHLCRFL